MDIEKTEHRRNITEKIVVVIAAASVAAGSLGAFVLQAGHTLAVARASSAAARAAESAIEAVVQTQWTPDTAGLVNEYDGIIRFHVIANSDSEEDQTLKLQVRNSVVMKLQNALVSCTDIGETRAYIEDNLDLIERWAADCVRGWGYDYDVKARIGVSAIPAKQYDDLYFPAGNYEALTITIGEGKGQNWWCVVFPPLCLVDASDEAYGELFGEDAQGRLVLRSRLLELLGKYEKKGLLTS